MPIQVLLRYRAGNHPLDRKASPARAQQPALTRRVGVRSLHQTTTPTFPR
jgi:hypothetical protein